MSPRLTALAAALLLPAIGAGSAHAADKIKVGFVSTLSGAGAGLGVDIRDGFNLAIKQLNGQLGGLPAEVIIADDQQNPDVAKQAANWLLSDFFGALNKLGKDLATSPINPEGAGELLALVGNGTISGSIAKQVLEKMLETGDAAAVIVEREGLKQTSDTGAIDAAVAKVLADNADKVEQYRGGKEALFGFFVGQTMKAMQGKSNPQMVNEAVKKGLAG